MDIIIATITNKKDETIVAFGNEKGSKVFQRGEEDGLGRFHKAAVEYGPESIARGAPDCPMLDPDILDRLINILKDL